MKWHQTTNPCMDIIDSPMVHGHYQQELPADLLVLNQAIHAIATTKRLIKH